MAASGALCMAQEPADTVKVLENASMVTVTRNGNTTSVVARFADDAPSTFIYEVDVTPSDSLGRELPDDWGMDFPFIKTRNIEEESRKRSSSERVYRDIAGFQHIYWGWRFNYSDKGGVKNCFEVGIREILGISWKRRGAQFDIGVGFGMKRFLAAEGYGYGKDGDKLTLMPMPDGERADKSRLDVWSFHLPVLYSQRISGCVSMSLGGIVDFNTYATAFTRIDDGKTRHKENFKGFQQNLLTVSAFGAVYLDGVGFYATWSPMELFKEAYGPSFKGWSMGVDFKF